MVKRPCIKCLVSGSDTKSSHVAHERLLRYMRTVKRNSLLISEINIVVAEVKSEVAT